MNVLREEFLVISRRLMTTERRLDKLNRDLDHAYNSLIVLGVFATFSTIGATTAVLVVLEAGLIK
jgi:hypothetical protein